VHSSKVQGSELQGAGCSLQDAGFQSSGLKGQAIRATFGGSTEIVQKFNFYEIFIIRARERIGATDLAQRSTVLIYHYFLLYQMISHQ
jgi:hypothetical protein